MMKNNISFTEFDKNLRKVHDKRNILTTSYPNHIAVRHVKAVMPSLQQYTKEALSSALQDIFLELKNLILTKGYILNMPYGMGLIRIKDASYKLNRYTPHCTMVDWPTTMQSWYNGVKISQYTVRRNMELSRYKASYNFSRHRPKNLKEYYSFNFSRPFRKSIYESYMKNKLICYE